MCQTKKSKEHYYNYNSSSLPVTHFPLQTQIIFLELISRGKFKACEYAEFRFAAGLPGGYSTPCAGPVFTVEDVCLHLAQLSLFPVASFSLVSALHEILQLFQLQVPERR